MDRFIEDRAALDCAYEFLCTQQFPFILSWTRGSKRTLHQNNLQRKWCNEAAEQLGDRTAEEVRGYCKLTLGIPILRAESEVFREKYDAILKPLAYEHKLALMMEPMDLPVTRIMTTKQKTKYLEDMHKHLSEQGVVLTDPVGYDPHP